MNEGPVSQNNLIETTDCLEAIGVFRRWKNLFFMILLVCLLLVQAAFWLVDRNIVPVDETAPAAVPGTTPAEPNTTPIAPPAEANSVTQVAAKPSAEPNEPAGRVLRLPADLFGKLDAELLARIVEFANGIMILTMVLYTVALFFSLMISLSGRLGGIRHISRAFFVSVILLVLVIPWQSVVGSRLPGVTYTLPELLHWMATKNDSLVNTILYYLRFSGYWLLFLLMLFAAQLRGARWTKSILRRLEII